MTESITARHNCVLGALSVHDQQLLEPMLEDVELSYRERLQAENRKIEAVFFPHSGIASVVAAARGDRRQAEVGVIGREGMTGFAVVLGSDRSPLEIFMQVAGRGRVITAEDLRDAMHQSPSLQHTMRRAAYTFAIQMAFTTLANSQGRLEERLARWLLMADDRSDERELLLTHEFLALMLGVRRSGVTIALQHLTSRGLIENHRGSVVICDRGGLEESAAGLYGAAEAEWERVFA